MTVEFVLLQGMILRPVKGVTQKQRPPAMKVVMMGC